MKSLGKSGTFFCVILAIDLLLAGCYAYIFMKIRQKNDYVAEANANALSEVEKKDSLKSVKDTVAETVQERGKIDTYFIPKDGVVAFLNSVQELATLNKLEMKIISVGIAPSAASDALEIVKINLEGVGVWADAYRMLALLELMPTGISVERANVEQVTGAVAPASTGKSSQKTPASSAPQWKLTLDVSVLKLK